MIVISVLIGLVAVVLATRWMAQQTSMATNRIAVAASDINLGTRLTGEMLKEAEWPKDSMPPGAIPGKDIKKLVEDGRVVKASLLRGEALLESKLAPLGTKAGLSAVITEGKRAITVRVNEVVGVAGFALPGNYVDVVVNTEEDVAKTAAVSRSRTISKIVLERILVLAVAQEASRDESKPKVVNAVTLEVTPEQAELLDLARSVGSLSLVLRNQVDASPAATTGVTKQELLKRTPEPETVAASSAQPQAVKVKKVVVVRKPAEKKAVPKEQVEVIKGVERTTQEF